MLRPIARHLAGEKSKAHSQRLGTSALWGRFSAHFGAAQIPPSSCRSRLATDYCRAARTTTKQTDCLHVQLSRNDLPAAEVASQRFLCLPSPELRVAILAGSDGSRRWRPVGNELFAKAGCGSDPGFRSISLCGSRTVLKPSIAAQGRAGWNFANHSPALQKRSYSPDPIGRQLAIRSVRD
jgi:hypothetical protein